MRKAVVALALLGAVAACSRVPPIRVLPNTIQSVYVPIFENRSYEAGLEERLTRFTQEELLLDGRISVVSRPRADVVLMGRIKKYAVSPQHFTNDEFPLTSRINMILDVEMYDPADEKREKPLMAWKNVNTEYAYVSDARLVLETSPQDATDEGLRQLARQIVMTVMNTFPNEVAPELGTAAVATATPPPGPPRRALGLGGPSPLKPAVAIQATTGTLPLTSPMLPGGQYAPPAGGVPAEPGMPGQAGGLGGEMGLPTLPNAASPYEQRSPGNVLGGGLP